MAVMVNIPRTSSNYSNSKTGRQASYLIRTSIPLNLFRRKSSELIKGKYVATLCAVCNGWEVSDPGDIFLIPIIIDIGTINCQVNVERKRKKRIS